MERKLSIGPKMIRKLVIEPEMIKIKLTLKPKIITPKMIMKL